MSLDRALRRWINRNTLSKAESTSRKSSRPRPTPERPNIERLESRILMAADPLSFVASLHVPQDITLSLVDKAGVPTIQITDTATSAVIVEKAKSSTTQVNITLSNQADTIRVKNDFSSIVPVTVDGRNGTNTLVGPSTGATFNIVGANSGTVDGVTFTQISRLQGANGAADVFVFQHGGSLSNGVDGGTGTTNTLIGPSAGATFTETGTNLGTVQEAGSSSTTSFSNIGKLQGGIGADTFVLNSGAASTAGFDGGAGLNTLRGTVAGTTYSITGADTGTAAGISFSHIGKVQGTSGAADQFVVSSGATLTSGIDGGGSAHNALVGPSTGASFTITGRDSGSIGGVSFQNVGHVQGADNAADTFMFAQGGSLTNGVDGGAGGQNTLVGAPGGATFIATGTNAGTVQQTGSLFSTAFNNVGKLQGGLGADTFVINSGATLTNGFDGGAGANALKGPSNGATYTVTGSNAGNVAGVTFTNIGQLLGANNATDTFVLMQAAALTIGVDGGTGGNNTLTGPSTGSTFVISGRDSGTAANIAFTNVGRLRGANAAPDTFTFAAGGSLSDLADGGAGGQNTLNGPPTGAIFTLTGLDTGTIQENGSTFSSAFSNLTKLQGGIGADTFIINAGAAVSNPFDGGAGINTVRGPAAGATYNITGADAGNVAGVSFTHVGRLLGANNAPDTFVLMAGGSLSTGVDGGTGGGNSLLGPPAGATFNITGLDAGNVGGTAFVNVGRLRGADNAPDTFAFAPGGALSTGVDGGVGGQNILIGPSTGATFTISSRDAGSVGTTAFTNVGRLLGANNAPDVFVFQTVGSLSAGLDGGAGGQNRLIGPSTGATFVVSRADGGTVQEQGSAFATIFDNVGNLQGADNVADTFIINNPAGSLTVGLSGGVDSNDTLRLLGTVTTASYFASGPQSGRYDLDGRQVVFSGIETIDDQVTSQNRIVTGTDGDDIIRISQSGTKVTVSAPSFHPITFERPSASLTVNGGGGFDSIAVVSNLALPGADLTLSSELITVTGETIDTTGGVRGAVTFNSVGLVVATGGTVNGVANVALFASAAAIAVANSTIHAGGAIVIAAAANYTGSVTGQAVAASGVTETARITITGSAFTASGTVNIAATTSVDVTVTAAGTAGRFGNTDAAVATTALALTSLVSLTNESVQSTGSVSISSANKVRAATTSNASGSSAGGSAADTVGVINASVALAGTNSFAVTASGSSVSFATAADQVISTKAISSSGGVSGATLRTGNLLANAKAATTEGPVDAAASVAVNSITASNTVDFGGTVTVAAPGGLSLSSGDLHTFSANADSTGAASNAIAASVAINNVNDTSRASVSGTLNFTGNQVAIQATENSAVTAIAVSGRGSAFRAGLAGALAINNVSVQPTASIGVNAHLVLNGASLLVSSTVTSLSTTSSSAAVNSGGTAIGVGPSIALNFTNNDLVVSVAGDVTGAGQVSLIGSGQDVIQNSATAGSAGGIAVTPVLALSSSDNDSTVVLNAGPVLTVGTLAGTIFTPGNVTIDLDRTQVTKTTADASVKAATAGIGAAVALSFGFQDTLVRIARNVAAASVNMSSRFRSDDTTNAIAGARGVDGGSSRGNAQGQLGHEVSYVDGQTGQNAALPDTQTSSGQFGLSAALAFNSRSGTVGAVIAPNVTVSAATGSVGLEALSDFDASATADASLVSPTSFGIGAAVALNSLSPITRAEIDGTVSAVHGGVTVRTGQATDTSSPGVDTIVAKAIAGAGGNTFGGAGALGLNVLGEISQAFISGTANVAGGPLAVSLSAAKKIDTTTIATADASTGAKGSGFGLGIGVALTISKNTATATIDGKAAISTGAGGLSLSATGDYAVHGQARAGDTGGAIGVAPSTFIVVSQNNTLAELAAAPAAGGTGLSLNGPVTLSAQHFSSIDGTAAAAGTGSSAGIGLSFTLAIVEDTAKALFSRSLTTTGPAVTGRASNVIDVAISATASSAGGATNGQSTSDGQIGKELNFANSKKSGPAETAPQADTSAGAFGLAGALSVSLISGQSVARQAAGTTLSATNGAITIEALSDFDSSATADASLVKPASSVGIGAAVAINSVSATTLAEIDGTVNAQGVTVHAGQAIDASSFGVDTVVAKAIAGAGGNTFGGAGALGLNVLGETSKAFISSTANVTGGTQAVSVSAAKKIDTTTIATADASAGAGGSGFGLGIGVAITLAKNSVSATIDGKAVIATGTGGLSLSAAGDDAVHGQARAGDTGGSVGVAPSTFIVVSQNNTLAELAAAPAVGGTNLNLHGPVMLSAAHTSSIDGMAAAAGAGASAGIGLSFTLAVVEDTAKALFSRSVSITGAGVSDVTGRASNLVDVTLVSKASAAGAGGNGQTNSDGQIAKELNFANSKKGGTAATAHSVETPAADGSASKVGIAGAISLSIVNSQSSASLATGRFITTPGSVTIEAIGDADSRVTSDASGVDKTLPQVGVGVAVALNLANHTTTAVVNGVVTSAGLAIHALAPSDPAESHSDLLATAISGAGARDVGVAGAFAANFSDMKSQALLNVGAIETGTGNVDIRSQVLTRPEAVASSSTTAAAGGDGNGSGVGVGLSVALNILGNQSNAAIPNGITLTGGRDVVISAQGENLSKTWAISGSSQGTVGITPALALLVAEDHTTATLGTGVPLNISGAFTLSAQQKVTGDTKSDAGVKGASSVGVGAAVALNIDEDTADASPSRSITAGSDVTVSADLVSDVQAAAVASTAGVSRNGGPSTTDGQVASTTTFANRESGASTTPPQVAKTNGGAGPEQSVGVSAALAINIVNGHARATLPAAITVSSGRDVAVLSSMDVDGIATADGTTAQQRTGIGVAVALNVITADNTARLIAPTTANGAITVWASMSANGDGVDTFVARANSGAASSQIGVAGAVALEIINLPTKAQILATVSAGGTVTVDAENKSDSTAFASSQATVRGQSSGSGGTGVGASFALSILNLSATSAIPDNVLILNAGGLTISASGDHKGVTTAEAGSASNISVSPAVAIQIDGSDTQAQLGAGPVVVTSGLGAVRIEAVHHGDYQTKADATAGGSNVSVGAAIALGIVLEHVSASTARDINAGGDVRIRATNTMASDAEATGGAKGNNPNANNADSEAQSTLNSNSNVGKDSKISSLPGGQLALPKSSDQVNSASGTASSQATGRGGAKVGVGAAIGINIVSTDALASIPANTLGTNPAPRSVTSRNGQIEVASALQVDGTAKAVGTAIADAQKNTAVGAGVALNVITATNAATIGDNVIIDADAGVSVTATMAPINGNATNDMVVQSAAAAGASKYGIAGSVSVDVLTYDTHAQIGQSANIKGGSGAVSVGAQADFTVQNLAGSGALGDSAGVGAAILVQTSTIGTTAIIKQNAQVDGANGVHVTSEMSYVPRADNFKGFGFALTSGAFGGAGSDGGTAIGGSVAVNVLNFNTESHLDSGVRVNQRYSSTGSVVVDAASTVVLFAGAGGVGVSSGNLGIGAGIDITIVNQKTLAQIADHAIVSAGGDVSVQAHSSSQQTAVVGSFGLSNSNGGSGSIAVSLFNLGSDPFSGTRALIGADAIVTSGGKVSVVASNPRDDSGGLVTDSSVLIGGSVAGANSTAVGIAVLVDIRKDLFIASVGDRTKITEGFGLAVGAAGALDVTMVAAAGVGGLETGVAGSVTVSTLTETASATIGQNVIVSGTTTLADVDVTAEDRTQMVKVAGAATFGGDLAIGAGLDVGVLTKNTIASIGASSQITTAGSVEVRAFSKEKINAFAASGGVSSEADFAGSVGVQVNNITTRAFIEGTPTTSAPTSVIANGNVIVEASAENEMDLFAGGLGVGGTDAIGASAPIPILIKTTEAFIGQNAVVVGLGNTQAATVRSGGFAVTYDAPPATGAREATTPLTSSASFSLNGSVASTDGGNNPTAGDPNSGLERHVTAGTVSLHGVAVSATNYDDLGMVAISGGVAGSVAVNVTGVVNPSTIFTSGRIEKGVTVNVANGASSDQSVLVVGANDYRSLIVSIGASVSGSAAIAPAVAVDVINLTAEALIAGTATVDAVNGVGVKARNAEDLQTVVASVGVASTAGISGSPSILVLNDRTTARIGDINTNVPDVAATVRAGGSVVVQALDDTSILDVDGAIGVGGSAGAGVGVAINSVSKDTTARIAAGSTVDAGGATGVAGVAELGGVDGRFGNTGTWSGLLLLAGSTEDISSIAIAGSAAGTIAGAGAVNLNIIASNTAATIGDSARINQIVSSGPGEDVRVIATNDVSAVAVTGVLGAGGSAGLAGAIGVGIVHNGTAALIGSNVLVNAGGNISVEALSRQDIIAVDVSGALGGSFAGAISTGTWVLGGAFNTGGGAASESAWATDYQSTLTGTALGGFSGMLGGNQPVSFANGDVNGNTIDLHTSTLGTGDAVIYHSNGNATGGLVDGQTYYLIKTGTTTYRLAATAADADAGRAVTLGGVHAGSLELADNSRAQAGLQSARNGLVHAQPTTRLSNSLGAGTAQAGTVALVKAGTSLRAAGAIDVTAHDDLQFVQVTGQVAVGGGAAAGGAFATLVHNNTVLAQIGDNVILSAGSTGIDIEALSSEHVVQVAAGAGLAGGVTILGSGTVTILNEATSATIGKSVQINAIISSNANPDVKLIANDDTTVTDVAGAVGFGGTAAVGVGADVVLLTKTTLATIDTNASISTQGSVELRATTSEDVVSVAAVGTAGGVAAVNLSASVVIANITTQAFIVGSASVIYADGNVVVEAASKSEYDLWGISAQLAGAAAVGASAAVPVITKNILADVGDGVTVTGRGVRNATTIYNGTFGDTLSSSPMNVTSNQAGGGNLGLGTPTYANGSNSDLNAPGNQRQNYDANQNYAGDDQAGQHKSTLVAQSGFYGVAVTATNSDDVSSTGIAIGAAGAAAVNLTGSVQVISLTAAARLGKNTQVNTLGPGGGTGQTVLVGAGNDFRGLDVATGVSIAGAAAVTPLASVQIVSLNTSALIDSGALVNAGDSVIVQAFADEQFTAVAAAAAGAAFAGVGLAPNITTLDSHTTASIGGAGSATVVAGSSVGVLSEDDSRFVDVAATLGVGFGGVGLGGNVLLITKSTQALISDGSSVTANAARSGISNVIDNLGSQAQGYGVQTLAGAVSGVVVQATSSEDITAITGSAGVGLGGIGLAGDIVVVDSDAIAHIGNNDTVTSRGAVIVGAANTLDVFTLAGGVGVGVVGVGGGVTVGIVRNGVEALIGSNATVNSSGDTEVIALSRKNVDSFDLAGGAGLAALAGSVGIWTFGGTVSTNYSYSDYDGQGNAGSTESDNALGHKASGWNTKFDMAATGSNAPGGNFNSILKGQTGGKGGNTSRLSAANQAAIPKVGAAKPVTSITAQLSNASGDIEGTTARIGLGAQVTAYGNVVVRAKDATTVTQTSGSFTGGVISVGAPIALVTLNMNVQASIERYATVSAGRFFVNNDGIVVEAAQTTAVEGFVFAGSGGLGTLGAQILIITDNTDQSAWVKSGAALSSIGNITINATSSQSYSGGAFGATINAIGLGASVAIANVNAGVHALMDGNTPLEFGSMQIVAASDVSVTLQTYGVGLSLAGGANGAIAISHIGKSSEARISDDSSTKALGDVTIAAVDLATADLSSYAIQLGGVVGIGIAVASATIDPTVSAHAGGTYQLIGTLAVVTEFNTDAAGNRVPNSGAQTEAFSVGAAIGAGLAGAAAVSNVKPLVQAQIDNKASVMGLDGYDPNVVVRSLSGSNAIAQASGIGVGVLGGVGASVALATVSGVNRAFVVGAGIQLGSSSGRIGAVTVDARSADDVSANTLAASGGILAGAFALNLAEATANGSDGAQVGSGAQIFVDSLTVNAGEAGGSKAVSLGVAIGGAGVAGAASEADATHSEGVDAIVDGSVIDTINGLSIVATTGKAAADARAVATGAALLAGITINSATAQSTGHTNASLLNGSVSASDTGAVRIHAEAVSDATSAAVGTSVGIVGVGSTHATTLNNHRTQAQVGFAVQIGGAYEDYGAGYQSVGAIEVSAQSVGTGSVSATGASGGIVTVPDIHAKIDVTPVAEADVQDFAGLYGSSVSITASNYAEGDGSLSGKTVSAIDFGSMELDHNVVQTAQALVSGRVTINTGSLNVIATGGDPALNPDPSRYDGISTASGDGFSVGIIGHSNGEAIANVTSNVTAQILNGNSESLTYIYSDGPVNVSANATARAKAVTNGSDIAGINLATTTANAFVNANTEALIGDPDNYDGLNSLDMLAYGLVTVSATAFLSTDASSTADGGGLASFGSSDAQARTYYKTLAGFGQDVQLTAYSLNITSSTSHNELTNINNTSSGGIAGSTAGDTNSGSFVSAGSISGVIVGNRANLVVCGAINVKAEIVNSTLAAFSVSNAEDGAGITSATATSIGEDQVLITLSQGSYIRGEDGVYITGSVSNYTVRTDARGKADVSIDADSYSNNYAKVTINIDAEANATVEAGRHLSQPYSDSDAALTVTTDLNVIRQAFANTDGPGITATDHYNGRDRTDLQGEHDDRTGDQSMATINWNADVILRKVDAPRNLVIDSNGVVTTAVGISVDGYAAYIANALGNGDPIFPLVGQRVDDNGTIYVDDISSPEVNRAVFRSTNENDIIIPAGPGKIPERPDEAVRNIITGGQGTWSIGLGAGVISIVNSSPYSLQIGNIDTVSTNVDPSVRAVSIQVADATGFRFAVSPFYVSGYDAPSVQISNYTFGTGGDIIINGLINNPVGTTYIDSGAGRTIQGSSNGLIRTQNLTVHGASIGYSEGGGGTVEFPIPVVFHPVSVEFVQSPGRMPHATIYTPVAILDVSTRLRDASVTSATVTFDELGTTSGNVHVDFHAAKWDSYWQSQLPSTQPPAGIAVGTSASSANDHAGISTSKFYRSFYYPDTYGPLSVDVNSAFGANYGTMTTATYNITYLASSNHLTPDPGVTINRPNTNSFQNFLVSGSSFAAASLASPILVTASDGSTGGVPLATPASAVAIESPLNTVVGGALTTYFGVTEADLAAIAAGAGVTPSTDVLAQDFAELEPSLTRTNRVTKPQILWQ